MVHELILKETSRRIKQETSFPIPAGSVTCYGASCKLTDMGFASYSCLSVPTRLAHFSASRNYPDTLKHRLMYFSGVVTYVIPAILLKCMSSPNTYKTRAPFTLPATAGHSALTSFTSCDGGRPEGDASSHRPS